MRPVPLIRAARHVTRRFTAVHHSSPANPSRSLPSSSVTRTLCAQADVIPKQHVLRDGKTVTQGRASEGESRIPDVPSTSLGIHHPEADDPLKWRKFAWKYAGAVFLFFVSYKTLHWYVDRLEADGKRKRDELEENKQIVRQIEGVGKEGDGSNLPAAGGAVDGLLMARAKASQDDALPQLKIFDSVKEEEAGAVSELDELYVYKIELDGRLNDMERKEWTEQLGKEKEQLHQELNALVAEIRDLESKQRNKS